MRLPLIWSKGRKIANELVQRSDFAHHFFESEHRSPVAGGPRKLHRRLDLWREKRPPNDIRRIEVKEPPLHRETLGAGGFFRQFLDSFRIRLPLQSIEVELRWLRHSIRKRVTGN